jgi:hypothetical protein
MLNDKELSQGKEQDENISDSVKPQVDESAELTVEELDEVSGGLIGLLIPATNTAPSVSEVNGDIKNIFQGNFNSKGK